VVDDGLEEAEEAFEIRFSNTPLKLANPGVSVTIEASATLPPATPPASPLPAPASGNGALSPGLLLLLLAAQIGRFLRRTRR